MRPAVRMVPDRATLDREVCAGKYCAEVGVLRGKHAAVMLAAGPDMLYLVDLWKHQDERIYDEELNRESDDAKFETFYRHVADTLGKDPRVEIFRMDSLRAAKIFRKRSLGAVYVDGNHGYEACAADLHAWWPRVARGGWLYGHDYKFDFPGVVGAVDEFLDELGRKALDVLTEDDPPSWGIRKAAI